MASAVLGSRPTAPEQEAGGSRQPSRFRADIEGLRSVAVLLVMADHIAGWPDGGFIGVDVFFVISGYLITGLLVRERRRSGRISFVGFYRRRARRLLPAAVVTLVVTNLVMWALFLADRVRQTLDDSIWAFFFGANVHFAVAGTDYFQTTTPPSPVQHFWSLAVEEQFYVVWPMLILGVFAVVGVRAWATGALTVTFLVVVALSLTWSVYASAVSPETAYVSTLTRAWELAVGALIALGATTFHRLPRPLQAIAAWMGIVGVLVSAVVITADVAFPGWIAILPVVCTALVVAFGHVHAGPGARWALGSPPMRFLGRISYSLYLWHWPTAVILGALLAGQARWLSVGVTVSVSVLLATVSYYVVEQPVLHSMWLTPKEPRAERRANPGRRADLRGEAGERVFRRARWVAGTALGVVGSVTIAFVLIWPPGTLDRAQVAAYQAQAARAETATEAAPEDPLTAEIRQSLGALTWEDLDPPLDALASSGAPEWLVDECLFVDAENVDQCQYGDPAAPHRAVLVGDSIAISWMPGLRAALEEQGWSIQSLTMGRCPNINVLTRRNESAAANTECVDHRSWALQYIGEAAPDLVILSNSYNLALDDQSADRPAVWQSGLEDFLRQVTATGTNAVVLAAPPGSVNLQECVTPLSTPKDCISPVDPSWIDMRDAEIRAAEAADVPFIDPLPWFCVDNACPAVVGNIPVYYEGAHLTANYSRHVADHLRPAVLDVAGTD
jgi:peptidoglycan/LPS O-acetylase OafA/YrhL